MHDSFLPSDSDFLASPTNSPLTAPLTPLAVRQSPLVTALNPEQGHAVTLPNEHALILAGAGSGKTRVLTTRIAWLLQNGHVSPGGVLAVTFTNKAAKEMKTRLTSMLPVNVGAMWIGTFHGLCNRFLRAHYKLAGLPQTFQILDTQDMLSAVKRLCKQHSVDDEKHPPKQLAWFISGCKDDAKRPKDVEVTDSSIRQRVEIYELYEAQCAREGVVDFAELMLRSYELLRDNDELRAHYQSRFRHILVDEFQDTNKLQYAWLRMFAVAPNAASMSGANSIFAVGDDDQSIYAFRGARVGNMADFVRDFAVKHQIKLEQNYRSYSNILDSANELISHNQRRLGKNLRTDQGAGEPVRVFEATGDLAEAKWIVDEARQLYREGQSEAQSEGHNDRHADAPTTSGTTRGVPRRSEIAVLYRSNAQSRVIETALFNAGVPYRVYGGLRFFERAEIKHALAYLRLMENPLDDTSFMRVVNFPPRGIGARSIEQLQDAARAAGISLYSAVQHITGKAGTNIGSFVAKIDVLREQTVTFTLAETIKLVLEHSGLLEHYKLEREGADRVENLEELVNAAESFVTIEGFGKDAQALPQGTSDLPSAAFEQAGSPDEVMSPLAAFLTHAALEAGDNMAEAGQDAVQLMTVHASKGLEFDAVFITGLEEGLFPHENAQSDHDGLEEERRLMYVAITRARKRLYLTHSQTRLLHGQTRYGIKSRFFDELPEACMRWITPKNQGFQTNSGGAGGHFGGGTSYGGGYSGAGYSGGYKPRGDWASAKAAPQAPPALVPKATDAHGLRSGMQVFHAKFGEGAVLSLEGVGADARAQVNFSRHGTKWLALSVAKLQII
jgi:DNA helicase II / ATP-dependent DNA helicase PcrA